MSENGYLINKNSLLLKMLQVKCTFKISGISSWIISSKVSMQKKLIVNAKSETHSTTNILN